MYAIKSAQTSNNKSSNNVFDLLDIEETIDDLDDYSNTTVRPSAQAPPKVTKEEQKQDEFNLAMYCLHTDLEEFEDYIVLELVRYAIDQQNSDTLPFLINTAIDQALYMENNICKLVEDPWTARNKFAEFDYKNSDQKTRAASSLKRLQGLIGMEMVCRSAKKEIFANIARRNGNRGVQHGRIPFPYQDSDVAYLTASDQEKWWIETRFLHTCWTEDSPKNAERFRPFYLDSTLKCIRELKYCSKNWNDGFRPGQIPIGGVFGIRLFLLATMIFGVGKTQAYDKLLKSTTRCSVSMQQWKSMEGILKNQWSEAQHVSSLTNLCNDFPTHKQFRNKSFQPTFEFSPVLCCLNDVTIRSLTSVLAMQVLDRSFIFRALAHLWNLLTEMGHLDVAWPDLERFINIFGEGYAYQGSRPTLRKDGKRVLWSRYFYAFGIKFKDVPQLIKKLVSHTPGYFKKIRPNWYFTTRNWPLLHILIDRETRGLFGNIVGVVDAGLIANSTVVSPLIGQQGVTPQFGNNSDGTCIDNKTDSWKLYDRGPGLGGVDRLLAIKKGLEKELIINEMDYLKIAQACVELVDSLLDTLDNLKDGPVTTYIRNTTVCKVKHISIALLVTDDEAKWKKVAKVFEQWLRAYGNIGGATKAQTSRSTYPLPIRPDVVQLVRSIVERRGLAEGIFTEEQEYGLGVGATYSWEEGIRGKAG